MFVKVNGKILDYEDYQKKMLLMKSYAHHALKEALAPYGFRQAGDALYSKELDLEVELLFKRSKEIEVV